MAFRRFSRNDWYGYEGAASLPDGPPLIREETIPGTGGEGSVIYLITGEEEDGDAPYNLSAQIFSSRNGEGEEWWYREETDAAVARRIGTLLPADADRVTLRALGFRRTV